MSFFGKNRKSRSLTENITIAFGFSMAALMIISLIAPFLSSATSSTTQIDQGTPTPDLSNPNEIPAIVFPTPVEGTPVIDSAGTYVHPSGTFHMFFPQGWVPEVQTNPSLASVSFNEPEMLSVIHAYLQRHEVDQDIDSLDALYDAGELAGTWSRYSDWFETGREIVDGRLVIDFNLVQDEQNYLGRHVTWAIEEAPTWSQVLRVVVPGNNPVLLDTLDEILVPSFQPLPEMLEATVGEDAYVDSTFGFTIKPATGWNVVDGGAGRTTTIADADEIATLTLAFEADNVIGDEDAAHSWLQEARPNAEIIALQEAATTNGDGYKLAYTYTVLDGAERSGLLALFNGEDGRLIAANLVIDEPGLNLLVEESELATAGREVLNTLSLLPEANLPEPEPAESE